MDNPVKITVVILGIVAFFTYLAGMKKGETILQYAERTAQEYKTMSQEELIKEIEHLKKANEIWKMRVGTYRRIMNKWAEKYNIPQNQACLDEKV